MTYNVLKTVNSHQALRSPLGISNRFMDEDGVASASTTPTCVALKLHIDNWRWQAAPFYLRSGKSLHTKATVITLQFTDVPHLLFPENVGLVPNSLSLCVQPNEGMHLRFQTRAPGAGMRVAPVDMVFRFGEDTARGI